MDYICRITSGPVKRSSPAKFIINKKQRKEADKSTSDDGNTNEHSVNYDGVVAVIDHLLLDPSRKEYYRLRLKSYPTLIIPLFNAIKEEKYELDFSNSFTILDFYSSFAYIFHKLNNLKSLNLSGCYLGDMNLDLSIFRFLEKLDVSNNCITNKGFELLCENLSFLTNLKSINLSYNLFNNQSISYLGKKIPDFGYLEEFIFIIDVYDYDERDYKQNDWSGLFNDFGSIISMFRNIEKIRIKGKNYQFKTEGLKSIIDSITSPALRVLELDNFNGTTRHPLECVDISFLKLVGMNSLEELIITRVNLGKYFSKFLNCITSLPSLNIIVLFIEGEYGTFDELREFIEYLYRRNNLKVLKLNEIFVCNELINYYKLVEESETLIEIELPLYNRFPPKSLKRLKSNYNIRNIQGLYQLEEIYLHGKVEDNFIIQDVEYTFSELELLMKLHLDLRECSTFQFAGILCCVKNTLKELKIEALYSFEKLFSCINECVYLEKLDISYSRVIIKGNSYCINNIKYLSFLQEITMNHCNLDSENILFLLTEINKGFLFDENAFMSLRSIDLRDNLYTNQNMLIQISEFLFRKIKYLNLTHLPLQKMDEQQKELLISRYSIKNLPNYEGLGVFLVTPSSTRLNRKGQPIESFYLLKNYGTVVVLSKDSNFD